MSLEKKLKPARKAWKAFTHKLRSDFHNLDVASSVKATARRLFNFCSLRLFAPFKRRFLARGSDERRQRQRRHDVLQYRDRRQFESNFRAIYIDRLYGEPVMSEKHCLADVQAAGTSRGSGSDREEASAVGLKSRRGKTEEEVGEQSGPSMDEAWKAVVAASPHLRVDERAEEFISKFRQEMNIAKEKSLAEFHEMLARGS